MAAPDPSPDALRRFLRFYLAYVFLFDFMLAYAVYTALFQLEGLSVTEIGILLAFWSASAIVLELPSGALSDHLDRRWLLVAAPLIKVLTFVVWGLADGNFWLYGLGFLVWSVSQALVSGTKEALLYEKLESEGRAGDYDRILGRDFAATEFGVGAGALLGGIVGYFSMQGSIWLSIAPLIVAAVAALRLHDVRRVKDRDRDSEPPRYLDHFRNAAEEFLRERAIRFLTLYIACGLIIVEILEEFDQLYYLAVSVPIWAWGMVDIIVVGFSAAASLHAHRFARNAVLSWLLPLVSGALMLLAAQSAGLWVLLPFVLGYLALTPAQVLAEAKYQRVMEGRSRATTTSVLVVAQNIVGIVLTLGFGVLADTIGILPSYGWAGVGLMLFGLWALWQKRRGLAATD
jgi:MFS family permease